MPNTVDTIRAVATYVIALVLIVGGLLFLYTTRLDPNVGDLRLAVVGFITAAITFAFQSETQTRTARQTQTASEAGAVTHANGIANVEHARYAAGQCPATGCVLAAGHEGEHRDAQGRIVPHE